MKSPRWMRTSELLRQTSSHLEALVSIFHMSHEIFAEYRDLAAELRVRAHWIELARQDSGATVDRRMGIAAIEDADVWRVETYDGQWALQIARRENGTFDASLISRFEGKVPHESHFRASLEEAIEKACDFLRDQIGQPEAADVLRSRAIAEAAEVSGR